MKKMRRISSVWWGVPGRGVTAQLDETGSLTAFVAVLSLALFILVGLVVDAGRAIAARSAAMTEAQQAARAGAGQISVNALRSGEIEVDPVSAIRAADAFLISVGQSGSASVTGQTVTVHIESSESTAILGIIGINSIAVSATASATNVHGVTQED